ncbi:hypothetical protein C7974DRAFT_323730 [Boeremia exigua]|uniref:uncharacterized protein n=1 Tax=Boeremia exigua TaxID=749465 RepID=UPI001E8D2802|nr:uncharacterized protein C7974DRAFT_323730 [Boeremia exigua]KAH6611971.1 hypothetical protein C7974DRAFT_323730 [Boeremia exigua]
MQHFADQLHPEHHSASLRARPYRTKRKDRHHGDDSDDNDSNDSDSSDAGHPRSSPPAAHSRPSFAAPELAQLRVAGLFPAELHQVPPSPFPHAPARVAKSHLAPAKIQKELAQPPARLYAVNARDPNHEARNLRRTHLNVLSTVMHKCLLQADYDRAGRAWGMILRTQATHGNTVDLRNHGRWAIGAELLLRRTPPDDDAFSEHGFELAREYYERLIVQHPTRKQAPHAVDQRSFYPAMFSLWIQEVCEKSRRARKQSVEESRSRSRSMSIDSGDGKRTTDAQSREDAIQVEELARAMEIAERLGDLVKSPLFDKQAGLLQLRGNVALWISDLIVGNTSATAVDEWDAYPINTSAPAEEQITKFKNCQRELDIAHSYLSRVEENGGPRQYHALKKIESRLKELQKQIAKLEAGGDDTNVSMEDDW